MNLVKLFREKFPEEEIKVDSSGERLIVNGFDTQADWKKTTETFNDLSREDLGEWIYMNCELMASFLTLQRKNIS